LCGEKLNEFGPVERARRRCLRDFVQRKKGAECPGAKIDKEAGLARHYGYWITVGFQGSIALFSLGLVSGRRLARNLDFVLLLRMPRRSTAMQEWAGLHNRNAQNGQG
jgi:hypothetical protein